MSIPDSPAGAPQTSKRLYLLRHAKSSWKDADLADHDRPLAGRGRRAADAIAHHMREGAIAPELVLCSTARRARETCERIRPALGGAPVRYEPGLYGASATSLLERLRSVPDDVGSVLLIGHNPAMEELAVTVARPSARRRDLEGKFPTGALATLAAPFPSWRSLDRGSAELVAFVRPRDLER
jgi:phosphohistidine phosphatase